MLNHVKLYEDVVHSKAQSKPKDL